MAASAALRVQPKARSEAVILDMAALSRASARAQTAGCEPGATGRRLPDACDTGQARNHDHASYMGPDDAFPFQALRRPDVRRPGRGLPDRGRAGPRPRR